MFVFFSNRLGCAGSILVSIVLTVLLLALMRSCSSGTVVLKDRSLVGRVFRPGT